MNRRNSFVFIALLAVGLQSCSSNENCKHLQKIKNGMTVRQVVATMKGLPDTILFNFQTGKSFSYLYYVSNVAASENVYINFSQEDSVVHSSFGCY